MSATTASDPLSVLERFRQAAIAESAEDMRDLYAADPGTIVVDQEVAGTSDTTGSFVLPNLMVMTVRDGEIVHVRDFANLCAVDAAVGGQPGVVPDRVL